MMPMYFLGGMNVGTVWRIKVGGKVGFVSAWWLTAVSFALQCHVLNSHNCRTQGAVINMATDTARVKRDDLKNDEFHEAWPAFRHTASAFHLDIQLLVTV
jgi:hypothetical protein